MKKTQLTTLTLSTLTLLMLSGHAWSAGHTEVNFSGSVTSTTCDLGVDIGNTGTFGNNLDLGSVAPSASGNSGTAKSFTLKPYDTTQAGCGSLTATPASATNVTITWGGALGAAGFTNQATGTSVANGARVTLKAVNSTTTNQVITSGQNSATFAVTDLTGTDGAQFEATLVGANTPGAYQSTATFTVTYS
ncbi:MAG: hypothetical protein RR818_04145 [Citrobacter sp.]